MNQIKGKVDGTGGTIKKFKDAGKTGADAISSGAKGMEESLGKTGDQLKEESDKMRDNAKDIVTIGIQLTIAFAYVVCFFAILTTICMSKGKGCLCCWPRSSPLSSSRRPRPRTSATAAGRKVSLL